MLCDVGREAGHQYSAKLWEGQLALRWLLPEILHVDGVSRRLMPENCAVATASKRGSFQMRRPCSQETRRGPRRVLGHRASPKSASHVRERRDASNGCSGFQTLLKPSSLPCSSATTQLHRAQGPQTSART